MPFWTMTGSILKSPVCHFVHSCNSCSTKCSSSKWLWEQQRLRGQRHGNIPPANQEVRGRGACHSPSRSYERLKSQNNSSLLPATLGHEWSILCSLSDSLWRLQTKKTTFRCLLPADKCVCDGCQRFWRTRTLSTTGHWVFEGQGVLHLKNPSGIF